MRGKRRLVVEGDVMRRLAGPDDLLDVILIDVHHSPDLRLDDLSVPSTPGLLSTRRHLATVVVVVTVCTTPKVLRAPTHRLSGPLF